jgi:hypothetical protein
MVYWVSLRFRDLQGHMLGWDLGFRFAMVIVPVFANLVV